MCLLYWRAHACTHTHTPQRVHKTVHTVEETTWSMIVFYTCCKCDRWIYELFAIVFGEYLSIRLEMQRMPKNYNKWFLFQPATQKKFELCRIVRPRAEKRQIEVHTVCLARVQCYFHINYR